MIEEAAKGKKIKTLIGKSESAMDNGYDEKLAEKLSGMKLGLENQNDSSLFQVMKAVEAAEATIKQQVEENSRLRSELQSKILLLNKYVSLPSISLLCYFHPLFHTKLFFFFPETRLFI